MEDVICPKCNKVNSYTHNFCSGCGDKLKGTCATCNMEENITFVEAGVCQLHVLEDREEFSEKLKILIDSVHSRFIVLSFGAMAISVLVCVVSYHFLPLNLKESGAMIIGSGTFILPAYFISLWRNKRIGNIWQTLTSNFKESHTTEDKLLKKVGWKIL